MIELEQTADGSYTLFVPELNEHYHSVKGALTESEHIFINMGMKHHPPLHCEYWKSVSEPDSMHFSLCWKLIIQNVKFTIRQ